MTAAIVAVSCLAGCAQAVEIRPVTLSYRKSPYSDYLFYLLYRHGGAYESLLKEKVPLQHIPELNSLISLPQIALRAASYGDVHAAAEVYRHPEKRVIKMPNGGHRILWHSDAPPGYAELQAILRAGEKEYPAFEAFWRERIAADEDNQIAAWRTQEAACNPMRRLQEMTRLTFPFPQLDVGVVALHFSGSANTDPPGISTGVWAKPNLPRVLGHEATHLLVDEFGGLNWADKPGARAVIQLAAQQGGQGADIEEALTLLMQTKLAQSCGTTPADLMLSSKLSNDGSVKYRVLAGFEHDWPDFERNPNQNLIEFMIHSAHRSLHKP